MANEDGRAAAASQVAEALSVLVLHTVERSGPLDGYQIATRLDRLVAPEEAPLDLPTLYAAILRQKQRGLLSATPGSRDGRRVRTYAITPRGRRYLKGATVAWGRSASLLGSLLEEQGRQRRELELAREVQTHFFSSLALPPGLGLDIAGRYRPARDVGGDYYDIIRLSDTTVALIVGDVSGKGIAAALLMATLRAFVRSQPGTAEPLAAVMSRLNQLLFENCTSERFATLFYAVYDAERGDLVYVNAGHPPPMVIDPTGSAPPLRLREGGPVLGLLPDCTYAMERVPLVDGHVLVAYTDGLTEACDRIGSDWGDDRLMGAIARGGARAAGALADHLLTEVTRFTAGGPPQDDMTLLVVRKSGDGLRG